MAGEQLDQCCLTAGVDGAESERMADRHQTLHPERRRAFCDQLERERAEVPGLVQVDVDADPVALGDAENDLEVGHRVTVEGAWIEATDEVSARPHGGIEQVGSARIAEDARLWECDHLHVGPARMRLPGCQHPLQALESTVGVDLGVTAHRRGTADDRRLEAAGRPLPD